MAKYPESEADRLMKQLLRIQAKCPHNAMTHADTLYHFESSHSIYVWECLDCHKIIYSYYKDRPQ